MKVVLSKIPRIIIYFLIMLLIISVVYLLIPKYQLINQSGHIYKLNRITGQVTQERIYFPVKAPAGYGVKKPAILLEP